MAAQAPPQFAIGKQGSEAQLVPLPELDRLDGAFLSKHLQVFRLFDAASTGQITREGLLEALERQTGVKQNPKEFARFLAESGHADEGQEPEGNTALIDFEEYIRLAQLFKQANAKKTKNRNIRAYFTPEQIEQYAEIFYAGAGDDGRIDASELADFLLKYKVNVPQDRVKAIMQEVDDDKSGFLEETEFMVLLIKGMGLKRRKVGPGNCPVAQLIEEGWSISELKKAGYEVEHFLEIGFDVAELMDVFAIPELKKADVQVKALMDNGWDGAKAREYGFGICDLVSVGCSIQKIRIAGWNDVISATKLRQLGVEAGKLKSAGWSMSELRLAGYSAADLRVAGVPPQAVALLDQAIAQRRAGGGGDRRSTVYLRQDADRLVPMPATGGSD